MFLSMLSKHLSIKRANERTSEPHVIYLVTRHYNRIQVTSMFHSFGRNIVGILKRVVERTFREKITDCKQCVKFTSRKRTVVIGFYSLRVGTKTFRIVYI